MTKLTIYRGNEFVDRMLNINIHINDKAYLLANNSSISMETNDNNIAVQAKYLWFKSKKVTLNTTEKEFKIKVVPMFKNAQVLFFAATITLLYFFNTAFPNSFWENVFKIYTMSFLALILIRIVFLFNRYFRLEIKP